MKIKILGAVGIFWLPFCSFGAEQTGDVESLHETVSRHFLKIEITRVLSAYQEERAGEASGFWLGGSSPFIITNAHVASTEHIARLEAKDSSGNKFPVKLVYANHHSDLAYLVPEKEEIVKPEYSLAICAKPEVGDYVFTIGNSSGGGMIAQDARITDICDLRVFTYPQKIINTSLNVTNGSSGSLVINQRSEIVGVIKGGGENYAGIVPAEFIAEDLSYLQQGSLPPKKDIGIIFKHISEKDAKNFYKYHLPSVAEYNNQFKGARSRLLQVQCPLIGTPGEKLFNPGDIITHVNGVPIGPDLFKYYNVLNGYEGQEVGITLFRDGQEMVQKTPLYDLNQSLCLDMIVFGKAVIARSTPSYSFLHQLPIGTIGLFRNPPGNIFSDSIKKPKGIITLDKMGNREIRSLDDVEMFIRMLGNDSTVVARFNYTGTLKYDVNAGLNSFTATYERKYHQTPIRMTYNLMTKEWEQKEIR